MEIETAQMTATAIASMYFVGDLCYVLDDNDWQTFCAVLDTREEMLDGVAEAEANDDCYDCENFLVPDEFSFGEDGSGRPFAAFSTKYGDGCYLGSDGNRYAVDSGTIGCIKVSDIRDTAKLQNALEQGLGHLHDFGEDFYLCQCLYDDGVIVIGSVEIDTN